MIHGTLPDCIHSSLGLEWLWIDENRIHGPLSEFSALGQYLKNVDKLNLAANRWAPLLPSEKDALLVLSVAQLDERVIIESKPWDVPSFSSSNEGCGRRSKLATLSEFDEFVEFFGEL